MRQSHNPQPLLFLDYGYTSIGASTEILKSVERFTDVTQTNATDWSEIKELKLLSPSTATAHPIWFIKLMCIRRLVPINLATTVPSAPPRRYALDHVFGPFRADLLVAGSNTNIVLPGKRYMKYVGDSGGAIVQIQKLQSLSELTLKAVPLFAYEYDTYFSPIPVLFPPRFFDDAIESKWQMDRSIIAKQVPLTKNGNPLTLIQENLLPVASSSTAVLSTSISLSLQSLQNFLLPALVAFDSAYDEPCLAFTAIAREQEDDGVAKLFRKKYITAHVELCGLLQNGAFDNNPPVSAISCFTLDSKTFTFNYANTGLHLPTTSTSDAYIPVHDFIDYVKKIESLYTYFNDSSTDTATRMRVHYYGPFARPEPGITGYIIGSEIAYGKGLVFNAAIAKAKYVKMGSVTNLDQVIMGQTADAREAYMRLTSHSDENGLNGNPSPYLVLNNNNENKIEYVDLGHLTYGFEAWQIGRNGTSNGFQTLHYPVTESVDFAGLMADLAPGIGEFLNRLKSPESYLNRPYYPLSNDIRAFYEISNPDADLISDADALGLSNAYDNMPNNANGSRPSLSQVLSVYYAPVALDATNLPGLRNHYLASHYSRRWLTLASAYGLIMPELASDKYSQNRFYWITDHRSNFTTAYNTFFERVKAVSVILYNVEIRPKATAIRLLNSPYPDLVDATLITTNNNTYPNLDSIIRSFINNYFLPELKIKILSENKSAQFI